MKAAQLLLTTMVLFGANRAFADGNTGYPPNLPNEIQGTETLKGQTTMAVVVTLSGNNEYSVEKMRGGIEDQLRKLGIKVVAAKDAKNIPVLTLDVSVTSVYPNGPMSTLMVAVLFRISFNQMVPVPGQPGKVVLAETWNGGNIKLESAVSLFSIYSDVDDATKIFTDDYQEANAKH
jgi:hypothetical protein